MEGRFALAPAIINSNISSFWVALRGHNQDVPLGNNTHCNYQGFQNEVSAFGHYTFHIIPLMPSMKWLHSCKICFKPFSLPRYPITRTFSIPSGISGEFCAGVGSSMLLYTKLPLFFHFLFFGVGWSVIVSKWGYLCCKMGADYFLKKKGSYSNF